MDNPKTFMTLAGVSILSVAAVVTYIQNKDRITDYIDGALNPQVKEAEVKPEPEVEVQYTQSDESNVPYTPEPEQPEPTVSESFDFSQSKTAENRLFDQLENLRTGSALGEEGVNGFSLTEHDDGTIEVGYSKDGDDSQEGLASSDGFGSHWAGESLSLLQGDEDATEDFYEEIQTEEDKKIERYEY